VGRVSGDAGFSGSVEKGESGAILLRKPNSMHRVAVVRRVTRGRKGLELWQYGS